MKRSFTAILLLFFYNGYLNAKPLADTLPKQDQIELPWRCVVEEDAKVDVEEWRRYLERNIVVDDASLDSIPAGVYKFFVQFIIDKEGKIINVEVKDDPGYGLGKKACDVISQFKGLWRPGSRNGRTVKSYRKQPITFIVGEEEDEKCMEPLPSNLIL